MPAPTRPTRPVSLRLSALADRLRATGVAVDLRGEDVEVTGCTLSTDRVLPGDLYLGIPGTRAHGASYAAKARDAGAVALLTDEEGAALAGDDLPLLVVESPRAHLGLIASEVYGHPADALRTIGITGTQGKTTTSRLLESGFTGAGVASACIGTVGTRVLGVDVPTALTTPEAPDLHGLFAAMRDQGVAVCAMEVSSHALVLGRVDEVVFDVAVFLNLGRDHLDFHGTVEEYYAAKARLFTPAHARLALVNVDDEHGRRLRDEASVPVRTFAVAAPDADWRAADVRLEPTGSTFTLVAPDGERIPAGVPLPGDFNVVNALAALAAAAEAGFDVRAVASAMAGGVGVPGRLERVDAGQDFAVVVDYAHKPDAVEAALRTLRPLTTGRLICVLGAGGDRDAGKRPVMGEIASRLADVLVITDDNPRSEDPDAIRAAIRAGATGGAEVIEEGDRRAAIAHALRLADTGDIVVVAGKGHETGQEVDGVVHPFDDRVVVREELTR